MCRIIPDLRSTSVVVKTGTAEVRACLEMLDVMYPRTERSLLTAN